MFIFSTHFFITFLSLIYRSYILSSCWLSPPSYLFYLLDSEPCLPWLSSPPLVPCYWSLKVPFLWPTSCSTGCLLRFHIPPDPSSLPTFMPLTITSTPPAAALVWVTDPNGKLTTRYLYFIPPGYVKFKTAKSELGIPPQICFSLLRRLKWLSS